MAMYIDLYKNRNSSEFGNEYPEECKAMRLDHYVDDFLKSFDSIEEAKRKQVYERNSETNVPWQQHKFRRHKSRINKHVKRYTRTREEKSSPSISNSTICRKFIPPSTPKMSGTWECMMQFIKTASVAILREKSPRDEILLWKPSTLILKTYPSPDNKVRVVDVKTPGRVIRRYASKIVVLVSSDATATRCTEEQCGARVGVYYGQRRH
ncbi:hypothetical protein EVAR_103667_1 [Eumeta japonica]|uniref:Uncharacterized protein n=1 Tax=Eumeta variegata TaxID=151549 RepID=A0A4C1Z1K5_EUMVA|nr:hypothetical protein EVAR_103667_1 [Eumeta japonica]